MTGHVDGVGAVTRFDAVAGDAGGSGILEIEAPPELARFIAAKGSIAVHGVSLTENGVAGSRFHVNLIPHALAVTTLGALKVGARVNLEVDLVARYVERLASYRQDRFAKQGSRTAAQVPNVTGCSHPLPDLAQSPDAQLQRSPSRNRDLVNRRVASTRQMARHPTVVRCTSQAGGAVLYCCAMAVLLCADNSNTTAGAATAKRPDVLRNSRRASCPLNLLSLCDFTSE